ncbi:ATP-binding protein [Kitasatospora indigofera]|uniref:ATP-binding protein n=1 Tax=Kitasatospora indigofera TaxID=67307 RepID=UPI003655E7A8
MASTGNPTGIPAGVPVGSSAPADDFCLMLSRLRVLAGLTQAELARAAGVSLRALGDMERGRTRGPQRRTVQALAAALRLDEEQAAALDRAARSGRPRRTPAHAEDPPAETSAAAPGSAPGTDPQGGAAAGEAVHSALALPRDIADFTARDEALDRLRSLAEDADPAHPRIVLAYGQPGLGKTAFALHAAHTLAPLFPDGQLSLDLRGMAPTPLAPREALAQCLRAIGVADRSVPAGTEERAGLFRTLVRERRLVLILDNAADEAQVRPLLPGSGPALTIITSRHVLPGLESVHRLPLDVLAPAESAALLARIAGRERIAAEPEAAGELARLCGHLPLALRIAGQRLVARPQQPVSHLVRQLAAEEYRLDVLEAGDLRVRTAFALSYRKLPAAAALVLRRCSLTAGEDFTADTVAAYAGLPGRQTDRQLELLADAGLLQAAATPGRYRLHDLVRLYAGERLLADDGREAADAAREQAGDRLLRRAAAAGRRFDVEGAGAGPSGAPDPDPATAPETLADARRWLEEEHPEWLAALRRAHGAGRHQQVVDTAEAMHWFSDSLLHWDVWAEVFQLSVDSARAVGDRLAQAVQLNYLAWAHIICLHRYRPGLAVAREALELARRIGDAQQEAWALAYCATALRRLLRHEEAIEAYRQAAEVFATLAGRSAEVGRVVALRCVGACLRESGRPREALETHRLVLAEVLDWLADSPSHMTHLLAAFGAHEAGLDRSALRQWPEAEDAYRQALRHFEDAGQPDSMTQTLTELGTVLIELDRADEARELLTTALADLTAAGGRGGHRRAG